MKKKIATVLVVGALGLGGVAVSGSASAAAGESTPATSRVQAFKDALAGLVGDGSLTAEQADEVATTLGSADLGPRGPGGGPGGGPGAGPGRAGGPDLATAATALGLSEDDLRTALREGTTLAAVAEEEGVPVDEVVTALVDAEEARIAEEVADGRLTQAQADERLAGVTQRVTDRVNGTGGPAGGRGGPRSADDAPVPDTPEAPATPAT